MAPDNRIAVCPGSYDPVKNVRTEEATRAARPFDGPESAFINVSNRRSPA